MSKISQYPLVTPVAGDKVVITQVNGSPTDATKNVTIESIAALSTQLSTGYTVVNGMINNLGSQSATPIGYDFMQWVSNVTPDTQIPLMRTLRKYQLMQVSWIYTGSSALNFNASTDKFEFDLVSIPDNSSSQISNVTVIDTMFELNSNDNGTFPGKQADLANQAIIIPQYTNLGVVCRETGSVTPTDGELGLSFLFQETV
tara:strand:- start:42039 stop:42641 length:603 start_codon:yes stop_codon:yes gene_type:complete